MEASVIICTHNPRPAFMFRVLNALRKQTASFLKWELIIVDNASDEQLTLNLDWHPNARLVREEHLGLSYARLRGMREASCQILIFVDDDNVLDSSYIGEAIRIGREWPMLGAWGSGRTEPEYEVEPAPHLQPYTSMLAFRETDVARWSNVIPCEGARPWGAGQCIRQTVARAYTDFLRQPGLKLSDRQGHILSSGGDLEIGFLACEIGLGVGIFPELKMVHLIPKERVCEEYLIRLAEGIGTSARLLEYKWLGIMPKSPISSPIEIVRSVKHLVMRTGIDRRMWLAGARARHRAASIITTHEARPDRRVKQQTERI
jgi:glycosyltransferase involved in cell wall biosynthesis